jgi:hypothetical protein
MKRKMKVAKILMLGLPAAKLPCIASAVVMPTGVFLEKVDMTFLGDGVILPKAEAAGAEWTVQVGAFSDREVADAHLTRVAAMLPEAFGAVTHEVTTVVAGNGQTFYRARFGGLQQASAQSACAALGRKGQSCFVAQEAGPVPVAPSPPELRASPAAPAATGAQPISPDAAAPAPAKEMATGSGAAPLDRLASAQPVTDTELQRMRGGFFTAAGAQFDFGASVKTMVNGQLVLQSNMIWTAAGAVTQQLAGLDASIHSQVNDSLAKAGIDVPSGGASVPATATNTVASTSVPIAQTPGVPAPSSAAGTARPSTSPSAAPRVASLPGVEIQSPGGGSTTVLANLGGNAIQNIVMNSASNQNIVQNTDVLLTIYNFPNWQQQLAQNAMSAQLAHEVMSAAGLGGSR